MQGLLFAAVVMWVIAAGAVVIAIMGPRRAYWTIEARYHRNPAAVEPSRTGYGTRQFAAVFIAVLMGGAGLFFWNARSQAQYESTDELYFDVEAAADELSGGTVDDGFDLPNSRAVEQAVFAEADKSQLELVEVDSGGSDADRYEVRTKDGRFAVCLVVSSTWSISDMETPGVVTASVNEGGCRS